jgi:hypothetical protein
MKSPTIQSSRRIKMVIFSLLPLLLLVLSAEFLERWTGLAEGCRSHVRAGTVLESGVIGDDCSPAASSYGIRCHDEWKLEAAFG